MLMKLQYRVSNVIYSVYRRWLSICFLYITTSAVLNWVKTSKDGLTRQFLTRCNTTRSHYKGAHQRKGWWPVTQCLDTYQLGAVSGEEVRLQRDFKQLTDCLERMCCGNRFHSDGAATAMSERRTSWQSWGWRGPCLLRIRVSVSEKLFLSTNLPWVVLLKLLKLSTTSSSITKRDLLSDLWIAVTLCFLFCCNLLITLVNLCLQMSETVDVASRGFISVWNVNHLQQPEQWVFSALLSLSY